MASTYRTCCDKFVEEWMTCSICLEKIDNPKVLPCLHSFCKACLQRHHNVHKLKNSGRLACPSCRELISVDEKGIDGFKDNVALEKTKLLLSELSVHNEEEDVKRNEHSCIGAEGGKDGIGQTREEIKSTIASLHNTLTKLRSKILQVYQIKNHVECALESQKSATEVSEAPSGGARRRSSSLKQQAAAMKQARLLKEHQDSLAQLEAEEERLYQSFVELKSTLDVLEYIMNKGSDVLLCASETKLQRLMTNVRPFLESDSPDDEAMGASGGLDVDAFAATYSPKKNATLTKKRSIKDMVKFPSKKGQKLACKLLFKIGSRGVDVGKFNFPVHVSFNSDGTFLVCDKNNMRIQLFSAKGEFLRALLSGEVKPRRACVSRADGLLYVSDEVAECVKVYTLEEKLVRRICEAEYQCPAGIDINSQGHIIMTDAEKCFVSVHKPTGEQVVKFYMRYLADRLIPNPYYAVFNEDNELIVSDFRNNVVKVFSSAGKLLFVIDKLRCPRGICVDPFGNILIAEGDGHRVSMYDPYGKFLRRVVTSADGLQYPLSVDMSPQGLLLVSQCGYYSPHEVLMFQVY